jgi:hypothetical protein
LHSAADNVYRTSQTAYKRNHKIPCYKLTGSNHGRADHKALATYGLLNSQGMFMSRMTKIIGSAVGVFLSMALAAPSYAHWGAPSANATYGVNKYCNHADAGNTNVRRARVRLIPNAMWIGWEGGGYHEYWDTVEIKNVSTAGRIDAVAVYSGPSARGYYFDAIPVNNLNVNRSVTINNLWYTNGLPGISFALCQVRNG